MRGGRGPAGGQAVGARRWGLVLALVAAGGIAVAWLLARPQVEWRESRVLVASLPYGDGVHDVGRWVGVDGRLHGPLSFAVGGGQVGITDTYHQRVLWHPLARADAPWTARSLPEAMVSSIVWDAARGGWLVADSRTHVIWVVRGTGAVPAMHLATAPGTTVVWEQLMAAPHAVYVAWTAVGAGQFVTALSRYRRSGRAQLVAAWGQTQQGEWEPPVRPLIRGTATSYAVGAGGRIYLLSPTSRPAAVSLAEFTAAGQPLSHWIVHVPGVVQVSRLVGEALGQVYLGVNLGVPNVPARIYATAPGEPPRLELTLPPTRELLHTYVRVGANGTLYWVVSTPQRYEIWAQRRSRVAAKGLHL